MRAPTLTIIETETTCDQLVDCEDGSWEDRIVRPDNRPDLRVLNADHERRTIWVRKRPFVPAFRRRERP